MANPLFLLVLLTTLVGCGGGSSSGDGQPGGVLDRDPPVITLLGPALVNIELGSPYSDAGATAADNFDGDITANIVIASNVNINALGNYTVTYNVSDAAGNAATQVTRMVNVNPLASPPGPPIVFGVRPGNATCLAAARPSLGNYAFSATSPSLFLSTDRRTGLKQIPGNSNFWFVADRAGILIRFANQPTVNTSAQALNIADRVAIDGERGLLGFAFSPYFASDGTVFVSYVTGTHSRISKFTSSNGGQTFADSPMQEEVIFEQVQINSNHNGGDLHFGPDDYLYLSLGDDNTRALSQNLNDLRGSLIRIDPFNNDALPVNASTTVRNYAIPADNPFVNTPGVMPEIFAFGFRNPWRFSIDRVTGDVWLGDVGEADREEIDLVEPGKNYGWPHKEGTLCYNTTPCDSTDWIDPVVEYSRSEGISVIAGYVYRGSALPELSGKLIFSEWSSGVVWALDFDPLTGEGSRVAIGNVGTFSVVSWGQDNAGEIYAVANDHPRLVAAGGSPQVFPQKLSETGCVSVADPRQKVTGMIPYSVNMPLWSDAALKHRWLALPDNSYISVAADGHWNLPIGSVLVKEFVVDGILAETRLMMRHDDGNWAGYSYKWNAAGTDADLVLAGSTVDTGSRIWQIPSATQCFQCHTDAAAQTLGMETAQLNRNFEYLGAGEANQITALTGLSLLTANPGNPNSLPALSQPDDASSDERHARDYLHVQCAHCHRPGSVVDRFDLRWQTSFANTGLCNVAPQSGDLGVPGALLLKPGLASESLVSLRMHTRGNGQMPKIGSNQVDALGVAWVDNWINSLGACP